MSVLRIAAGASFSYAAEQAEGIRLGDVLKLCAVPQVSESSLPCVAIC